MDAKLENVVNERFRSVMEGIANSAARSKELADLMKQALPSPAMQKFMEESAVMSAARSKELEDLRKQFLPSPAMQKFMEESTVMSAAMKDRFRDLMKTLDFGPRLKAIENISKSLAASKQFDEMLKTLERIKGPAFEMPVYTPRFDFLPPKALPNRARDFYQQLVTRIKAFDEGLDETYETGVELATFTPALTFRLTSVGYCDPDLIALTGATDDNEPIEVIQHVTQSRIALLRIRRTDPTQPKRSIGFLADFS